MRTVILAGLMCCAGAAVQTDPLVNPPAPFLPASLVRATTTVSVTGAGKDLRMALVNGDKSVGIAAGWPGSNLLVLRIRDKDLMQFAYWGEAKSGKGFPYNETPPELAADPAGRSFSAVKRFTTVAADDATFRIKASVLDDGSAELAWLNTLPPDGVVAGNTLMISSSPYGAFEGMKLLVGDRELAFSPAGASPGDRVLFDGAFEGRLTFMPDQPERTFSLAIPAGCRLAVNEHRKPENLGRPYQYAAQIVIQPGPGGDLKLGLDLGSSSAESLQTGDTFAGIDFWRDDRMHIPAFTSCRNLLGNPSFEAGMRYWIDGHWFEWSGEAPDNFSVDDTVAFKGRSSLKVVTRADPVSVMLGSFVIPTVPGRKYTFSFHGRTASPGFTAGFRVITAKWGIFANLGDFKLEDGWKRYSGTFTAPNEAVVIALHPFNGGAAGTATGWIDALQLEEGETPTDYAEPAVQVALLTSTRGNFLAPGARLDARLRIRTGLPKIAGTVACSVEDFLYRNRFTATIPFTSDEAGEAVLELPLQDRLGTGVFVVRTDVRLGEAAALTDFHRITIMDPVPATLPNKGLFATMVNPSSRLAEVVKRFSDLGFGSTNYEHDRRHADLHARFGLVNSGSGIVTHGLYHADPAEAELVKRLMNEPYSDELAARLERFSFEAVTAYPWINTWFMAAEARLQFKLLKDGDEEGFVRYILACRRGAKKAAPDKPFLFDGGPDNMNPKSGIASLDRWLAIAGRLAPEVRFDGFAIHPYRYAPEQPDLDEDTALLLAMLGRHGYTDQPVLFNEGIYNAPWNVPAWRLCFNSSTSENDAWRCGTPTYHMGWAERASAAYFARSWLVALKYARRVKQLNGWSQGYLVMDADLTHFALAKIPNTLCQLLGDATFARDVRFAVDTRSYVFVDGQGRPVVALWSHIAEVDRGQVRSPVARMRLDPATTEVFDLMGNRQAPQVEAGGLAVIPVTPFPTFIRGAPGTLETLCAALSEASLSGAQAFPLAVEVRLASRESAELVLANRISRPFTGSAEVGGRRIDLAVPGAAATTVPIPLVPPLPFTEIADLSRPLSITDRFGVTVHKDFAFHAFAVAQEKPGVVPPWIAMTNWRGYGTPKAPAGFTAAYRMSWSASALTLQVQVRDAAPTFPPGELAPGKAYDFDSLQIYLDTLGDNAGAAARKGVGEAFGPDNYSYMVSRPASSGAVTVYRESAPDQQLAGGLAAPKPRTLDTETKATVTMTADGYLYELRFPNHLVAPLPLKAGTFARLALMVNANDGSGRIGGLVNLPTPDTEPIDRPEEWPGMLLVE